MLNRRKLLQVGGAGLLGLNIPRLLRAAETNPQAVGAPRVRAKRVIFLFQWGGPSHVDMFDYKPLLNQRDGQPWDPGETVELFQSNPGACLGSPWAFQPYGKRGAPAPGFHGPHGPMRVESCRSKLPRTSESLS